MIQAIRAEWEKIWFPKSSRLYLPIAMIFSILMGLVLAFTTEITQNKALSELKPMSVIEVNMLGVDVVTILLIFFTAVQIGREFQGKTIQTYLTATPDRTRYFVAKLLTYFSLSLVVGVIVALIVLGNGQLMLSAIHGQTLPASEVWQFVAGCVAMPLFYIWLTVSAAFLSRNTAAGIVIPLVVLFLPAIAELFPGSIQDVIVPILPASAIHSLSGVAQSGSIEYTGIVTAFLILIIWSLLTSILAVWSFRHKDI
ncbi:ABC transporter [Paenibacillus albiflavus]|uniref:ABC transporter n=1 Tax=Paenibacillus albiflavus TaxID=2545760 RepID=A0A4R4EQV4_9BACL|nr:ABC transporter permease [Paenibacillus albiflavus]TCZ80895.1 ABC transporter [Paenibacillus albiflavus]